jgi:hypothetical protein
MWVWNLVSYLKITRGEVLWKQDDNIKIWQERRVIEDWRKFNNEELHSFNSLPDINSVIKLRMELALCLARVVGVRTFGQIIWREETNWET